MTERVIRLHDDHHREVQMLLPWFERGKLDALEHAQVEAHLLICSECQAELAFERQLAEEIRRLPLESCRGLARAPGVHHGLWFMAKNWLGMAGHLAARSWRANALWLRWAVAVQTILLLFLGAIALSPMKSSEYHALSASPTAATGNVVVIFSPDTREKDLRETLRGIGARLVDGPTAADAYVISVPASERLAILAKLRERENIVLAEAIDSGAPR
ncbi:MAG: zf-HC2 domain-containing protein [Amphiplicatus sp.]